MYFFFNFNLFENCFKLISNGFIYISFCFIVMNGLYYYSLWKIFEKCKYKGWYSLIPFYSNYILIKISRLNWWWIILSISYTITCISNAREVLLISKIITFFASWNVFYNIAKKFGYSDQKALFISFASPIFVIINGINNNAFNDEITVYNDGLIDLFYNIHDLNNKKKNKEVKKNNDKKEDNNISKNTVNEKLTETDNNNKKKSKTKKNKNELSNLDNKMDTNELIKDTEEKYCIKCGNKLTDIMNYCPICGNEKDKTDYTNI